MSGQLPEIPFPECGFEPIIDVPENATRYPVLLGGYLRGTVCTVNAAGGYLRPQPLLGIERLFGKVDFSTVTPMLEPDSQTALAIAEVGVGEQLNFNFYVSMSPKQITPVEIEITSIQKGKPRVVLPDYEE